MKTYVFPVHQDQIDSEYLMGYWQMVTAEGYWSDIEFLQLQNLYRFTAKGMREYDYEE